jgi:hypothetical protein
MFFMKAKKAVHSFCIMQVYQFIFLLSISVIKEITYRFLFVKKISNFALPFYRHI